MKKGLKVAVGSESHSTRHRIRFQKLLPIPMVHHRLNRYELSRPVHQRRGFHADDKGHSGLLQVFCSGTCRLRAIRLSIHDW